MFSKEVQSEIQLKKETYTKQLKDSMKELRDTYQRIEQENTLTLRTQQLENSSLDSKLQLSGDMLQHTKQEAAELRKRVKTRSLQVEAKKAEINSKADEGKREIVKKARELAALRTEFAALNAQYDALDDMRVALDLEIKRYTALLENEEDRLQYVSPHKAAAE